MAEQANEKEKEQLKSALKKIDDTFGKGTIMSLGEGNVVDIQGISTGSLTLDIALGGKGLPRGRIIEIYGPEASGKTTVALHTIASAQKAGGIAAFIDAEHALDPGWAKRLGVDLESLLVSQPSCAEDALQIADMLIKSRAVDIIVIDSVAALVPRAEVEGDIGDTHVGLLARLMSQALRMLTPSVSSTKTCLIFINQIRQKIGVYGPAMNPETTSGGLALKFFSSVRLDVRRISQVKASDAVVGNEVKVKVVKNKVAPPFRQAEFELMHESGISREGEAIDLGLEDNVLHKSNNSIYYGDIMLGRGRESARTFLRENPTVLEEILRKILEPRSMLHLLGSGPSSQAAEVAPAETEAPTTTRKKRSTAASANSES